MKPIQSLATLAAGFTAAAALGAEPAPKLVPRPLPGMGTVQALRQIQAAVAPSPKAKTATPAPAESGEAANRARVLFIHRRGSLPAELTANLPKANPNEGNRGVGMQLVPARSGKIRIIPKAAVAALLAKGAEEKPATENEP